MSSVTCHRLRPMPIRFLLYGLVVLLAAGCSADRSETSAPVRLASAPAGPTADAFGDYWYQGEAELTSYTLEQARYGEVHPGEAVLIFVTEPFSRSRHVKLDRPGQAGDDEVTVLKLNMTRSFTTGIYPYSMMASVFTPVDRRTYPHTLKVTTTAQEWCGHTFTQINRTRRGYRARLFSYFEREGDRDVSLPDVWLEDALWTTIRLNPDDLPTGEVRMLPGTFYQRFRHIDLAPQIATASLEPAEEPGQRIYTVTYPDIGRTLSIRFRAAFPHEIEGWTETYRSGFGPDAPVLTTRADRKARLRLDYWTHNSVADSTWRARLGLASSP